MVEVCTCRIYQGYYGARNPKFTSLYWCTLERTTRGVSFHIGQRIVCLYGFEPREQLSDGGRKTYPKALCGALAALWCNAILENQPFVQDCEFPDNFRKVVETLHWKIGMGTQGPDFCPEGGTSGALPIAPTKNLDACWLRIDGSLRGLKKKKKGLKVPKHESST